MAVKRTSDNKAASARRGIQSIEIGVGLLEALTRSSEAMTLTRLSQEVGLPPSNAHRYLKSFVRMGLVRQDPASGRYDLGAFALQLGLAALARLDILESAAQRMKELTREVHVTGLLSIWGELGPTIVRWQRSSRPFVTALNVGSVLPVLGSATGHVFLAWLPREVTAPLVDAELRRAGRTGGPVPASPADVTDLVERTRSQGYATIDGRLIPGLRAISAPVLDMQGEASAAITLIDPEPTLVKARSAAAKRLLEVCGDLSRENGHDASKAARR